MFSKKYGYPNKMKYTYKTLRSKKMRTAIDEVKNAR